MNNLNDIKLQNMETGDEVNVKPGIAAYYLFAFIPFIGEVAIIILAIMRKQFKTCLDLLIINIGLGIILSAILKTILDTSGLDKIPENMTSSPIWITYIVIYIVAIIIYLYVYIDNLLNLNYYTLNSLLDKGYVIKNKKDLKDNEKATKFLEKAKNKKKFPWYGILVRIVK